VLLSVRPEAIEVIESSAVPSEHPAISGQLIASTYQGAFIEYEIAALGRSFKARAAHSKGKRLFERGEQVAISFATEDMVVIPGGRS
jgi:ABC-type Fe3+/spermidine/putrescine transport system ATPase subunit